MEANVAPCLLVYNLRLYKVIMSFFVVCCSVVPKWPQEKKNLHSALNINISISLKNHVFQTLNKIYIYLSEDTF